MEEEPPSQFVLFSLFSSEKKSKVGASAFLIIAITSSRQSLQRVTSSGDQQ
jgi:hypothetical protein